MGQPYKLGTFDNQGCTYDSWFLAWSSKKKHHPYSSDNNNTDPTGKSFPRGTGWLWRPFWRNGWWNLCNPHIMWSDCSWKKQSRRLWTSDSRKIYWVGLKNINATVFYMVLLRLVGVLPPLMGDFNKWPFPGTLVDEPLSIWRRFTNIIKWFLIIILSQ